MCTILVLIIQIWLLSGPDPEILQKGLCRNCTHKTNRDIECMLFGMQYSKSLKLGIVIRSSIQKFLGGGNERLVIQYTAPYRGGSGGIFPQEIFNLKF